MPLSRQHRHAVLLAERTRDISTITAVVTEVLAVNPETSLLDIETALRRADRQSLANITEALAATPETSLIDIEAALRGAATSQAYMVANSTAAGFQIVLGTIAWHAALADGGLTVEQNWAALAKRK